jgi:hypothetical protein
LLKWGDVPPSPSPICRGRGRPPVPDSHRGVCPGPKATRGPGVGTARFKGDLRHHRTTCAWATFPAAAGEKGSPVSRLGREPKLASSSALEAATARQDATLPLAAAWRGAQAPPELASLARRPAAPTTQQPNLKGQRAHSDSPGFQVTASGGPGGLRTDPDNTDIHTEARPLPYSGGVLPAPVPRTQAD